MVATEKDQCEFCGQEYAQGLSLCILERCLCPACQAKIVSSNPAEEAYDEIVPKVRKLLFGA